MTPNTTTTTLRKLLGDTLDGPDPRLSFFTVDKYGRGREDGGLPGPDDFGGTIGWSALDSANPSVAEVFTLDTLSGSDYDGGALVRSNLKAIRQTLETLEGFPFFNVSGSYGSDAIVFVLDATAPESVLAPVAETIKGLLNYPSIDDKALSAQEHEEEAEAWENGAASDFGRALASAAGLAEGEVEADSDSLFELFRVAASKANLNGGTGVVHSDGEGPSFMIERAAQAIHPALLFYRGHVKLDSDALLDLAAEPSEEGIAEAKRLQALTRIGLRLRRILAALIRKGLPADAAGELMLQGDIIDVRPHEGPVGGVNFTLTRYRYDSAKGLDSVVRTFFIDPNVWVGFPDKELEGLAP